MKVAENGLELEQLHPTSHQLLERSMLLIMKAQWQTIKKHTRIAVMGWQRAITAKALVVMVGVAANRAKPVALY
jgi:hypothetical protein